MGGGWTEPGGRAPGQQGRWIVCISMLLLAASALPWSISEVEPLGGAEGLEKAQEEIALILPETGWAGVQLWYWIGTVVPLHVHLVLGQVLRDLWGLLGAPFGSLVEDAVVALDGSGELQSAAAGRLSSTVLGLGIGLLLLPVTVRGLERGLRVLTAVLPDSLQRFVAKRVARFVGKALTYVTLSLTAAEALG